MQSYRIILFLLFAFAALTANAQTISDKNRTNIRDGIQRCKDGGGTPILGCWIYTDAYGRQTYITTQNALDSLLNAGLRDTILAYVVSGSDMNLLQDNITGDGNDHTHNQRGNTIQIDSAETWAIRGNNVNNQLLFDPASAEIRLQLGNGSQSGDLLIQGNTARIKSQDSGGISSEVTVTPDYVNLHSEDDTYILGDQFGGDLPPSGALSDSILTLNATGRIRRIHPDRLGGVASDISGLEVDEVLFGAEDNTVEQSPKLRYVNNDSLVLDSALTINGVSGLTPTTVKVLKSGILEWDGNFGDDPLEERVIWAARTPQKGEGSNDFLLSVHSANYGEDRNNQSWFIGLGEQDDTTSMGFQFEDHYLGTHELHLILRDSSGTTYRPWTWGLDKSTDHSNWSLQNYVGQFKIHDPDVVPSGNDGLYASVGQESGIASYIRLLGGDASTGGGIDGIEMLVNTTSDQFYIKPFGSMPATAGMYTNQFGFNYVNKLGILNEWGTLFGSNGQATSVIGREASFGGVVGVDLTDGIELTAGNLGLNFETIADSIAAVSPTDSVFSMGDLICIVTSSMDTICADTAYYDDIEGEFCVVDMGDTTCVVFTPAGVTLYTGNSTITTPRTAQMNDNFLWFRNGFDGIFQLDPSLDGTDPTAIIWNKENGGAALSLNGIQNQSDGIHIWYNGVTAAGFVRDYYEGVSIAKSAFVFGESNLFDSDNVWEYHGDADSLNILKGVKLDGILWDEDGDIGTTGDVLTKQADGTVNWAAGGSGGPIPINDLEPADATNTIDNAAYQQEWKWDAITSGVGLKITSANTGAASNTQQLMQVISSGANSNSGQSTFALAIANTHTGTTSTNVGISSSSSGATVNWGGRFTANGTGGTGAGGFSDTGIGLLGEASSTGIGVRGRNETTGKGIDGISINGIPISGNDFTTATNSVTTLLQLSREPNGTPTAGIGGRILMNIKSSTTSAREAGQIVWSWTDLTDASRTSALDFYTVNSTSSARKMRLAGNGQMTLDTYGSGTHTGTATKWLAVTAAGLVIEENAPSGGSYTDEQAQDAVGAMIDASLNYVDGTPLLQRAALTGAITASAGSNATVLGSFTKSQLSTAVSDGDVLFVGDAVAGTPGTVAMQFIIEHWDVDVVDGTEIRFNIPEAYDLYEITRIDVYHTTAGVTNATTYEIENISAAQVIDNTLSVASTTITDSTTGLTYEVEGGEEISIEVTGNSTTEALGSRVVIQLVRQ